MDEPNKPAADFWTRSFDKPKAAKIGCAAVPVIAVLATLGMCSIGSGDNPVGNVTSDPVVNASQPTPATKSAPKAYTDADIPWEYSGKAASYKPKVVAGINKVLRDNSRCSDVDLMSLYEGAGFTKSNPVFFIQCKAADGSPFGVTFNVNDVDDNTARFSAATIISEADAKRRCMEATERDSSGLRSVAFGVFMNGNYIPHDDGRATIALAFSAKNAVGITDSYKVICFFKGTTLTERKIMQN